MNNTDYRPEQPVLLITGPTASGKTGTSLLLAEQLNGEVVSADSMQIYQGMDIGTAKATAAERSRVPHHLLDIRLPGERYSVADYKRDATAAVRDIYNRGKTPVLCGGTGQYLSAMIDGLVFTDTPTDYELREKLNQQAASQGLDFLYERLRQCDPESAARLAPGDQKRIVRALEIFILTGKTIGFFNLASRLSGPDFCIKSFCLNHDRPILYDRINQRVNTMVTEGLADEVRSLLAHGLDADSSCLQAIGYKEMLPCLRGEVSLPETIASIQQATRRYAKRQLTWFRKMTSLTWLTNQDPGQSAEIILAELKNIGYIR